MRRVGLSVASVAVLVSTFGVCASADEGVEILSNLKFNGEIRARYESADNALGADATRERAQAFTTRTALGVSADLLGINGLTTYMEGTSVNNFGLVDYNAAGTGNNLKPQYDLIKDPQQARMTQGYLDYKINKTLLRGGRQSVNLDNQRYVGSVDWRQMPQTFDALALVDNTFANLSLMGAYVYGINGIGEQQAATDTKSVLLHAAYKVDEKLNITAYDYMLGSISDTYGVALTGKIDANSASVTYRAEYALQTDLTLEYKTKNIKADAKYYNLDIGANIAGVVAGVNYESLGKKEGSAVNGFATPLATLHAFNGWADVFLATPAAGLKDANIRLGYEDKTYGKLLGVYHKFNSEDKIGTSNDLGSELDISYVNKIPYVKNLIVLAKGALYKGGSATGFTNDKKVAWLQLDYKFATK